MDAFTILQVAVAVFLGNVATLATFKAWQRMKREDRFDWVTGFYWITPLSGSALVLYLAR